MPSESFLAQCGGWGSSCPEVGEGCLCPQAPLLFLTSIDNPRSAFALELMVLFLQFFGYLSCLFNYLQGTANSYIWLD